MRELSWHDFAFRPAQLDETLREIRSAPITDASRRCKALEIIRLLLDGVLDGGRHGFPSRELAVGQVSLELADHTAVNARCRLLTQMAARIAAEFNFCVGEVR
jgi:hypothetical protein